jgi:hypothetical protein
LNNLSFYDNHDGDDTFCVYVSKHCATPKTGTFDTMNHMAAMTQRVYNMATDSRERNGAGASSELAYHANDTQI